MYSLLGDDKRFGARLKETRNAGWRKGMSFALLCWKDTLTWWCLSKDLKEVRGEPSRYQGEDHSTQRKYHVQRP